MGKGRVRETRMAEAKLHQAATAGKKLTEFWPLGLALVVYLVIAFVPSTLGDAPIVSNLRLISSDRLWLIGILYGVMRPGGQHYCARLILGNLARLSFGVALIAAIVTSFSSVIPAFYLMTALGIGGIGAGIGAVIGPRGWKRVYRHVADPSATGASRTFRLAIVALAIVLSLCLATAWIYQVVTHHDGGALAYGLCAIWGLVIARPAFGKTVKRAA